MDDSLKIYIDRLRDGHVEHLQAELAPDFIAVEDANLSFKEKVAVEGQAYLAEDKLILQLSLQTQASCRCVVCNEKVPYPIRVDHAYHSEEVADVKGAVFDPIDLIREMILLEIPAYLECSGGRCPLREQMSRFLKKESDMVNKEEEGYHPFAQLSLEDSQAVNRKNRKR